jgi:hypothetical protein
VPHPAADWYQQVLTPPEVFEIRIRLGFVPETDHAQALVEMFEPTTGVQMGMASIPHERIANFPHLFEWAVSKATDWITEQIEPF